MERVLDGRGGVRGSEEVRKCFELERKGRQESLYVYCENIFSAALYDCAARRMETANDIFFGQFRPALHHFRHITFLFCFNITASSVYTIRLHVEVLSLISCLLYTLLLSVVILTYVCTQKFSSTCAYVSVCIF